MRSLAIGIFSQPLRGARSRPVESAVSGSDAPESPRVTSAPGRVENGVRGRGGQAQPVLRRAALAGAIIGSAGVASGAAQPWLTSGNVERSAYALARSARRLGLLRSVPRRVALDLLFLVPILAGLAIALIVWRKPRWAVGPCLTVGLIGLVAGLAGLTIPGDRALGPLGTMVAGVVGILGAVGCWWTGRDSRKGIQ